MPLASVADCSIWFHCSRQPRSFVSRQRHSLTFFLLFCHFPSSICPFQAFIHFSVTFSEHTARFTQQPTQYAPFDHSSILTSSPPLITSPSSLPHHSPQTTSPIIHSQEDIFSVLDNSPHHHPQTPSFPIPIPILIPIPTPKLQQPPKKISPPSTSLPPRRLHAPLPPIIGSRRGQETIASICSPGQVQLVSEEVWGE